MNWIYQSAELLRRLRMEAERGFWIDHWLFLHVADSYPIWSGRPLSLHQIASEAIAVDGTGWKDKYLRQGIETELLKAREVSAVESVLGAAPNCAPFTGSAGSLDPSWRTWCEKVCTSSYVEIACCLIEAIANALERREFKSVLLLNRCLSAQLLERNTPEALVVATRKKLLGAPGAWTAPFERTQFKSDLISVFVTNTLQNFKVEFSLLPVAVNRLTQKGLRHERELVLDGQTLVGVVFTVSASTIGHAKSIGLEKLGDMLDRLRLIYGVRTHAGSDVVIRAIDEVVIKLPHPFWAAGPHRRKPPRIPKLFDQFLRALSDDERARVESSTWHVSQAIASWPEDAHGSAAKVWQALESLMPKSKGNAFENVLPLVEEYMSYLFARLPTVFASRVRAQVRSFSMVHANLRKMDLLRFDWDCAGKDEKACDWIAAISDPSSSRHIDKWGGKLPPFPFLFDHSAGLIVDMKEFCGGSPAWIKERLTTDLKLLYGIRCKAVHRGKRALGAGETAWHLARLGLEMFFAKLSVRAKELKDSEPGENMRYHIT